jgi:ABC-type Fe3+-hydroxamate transport system substrate-binding protein
VQEIIDLGPDLVIANREENERAAVEALMGAGIPTWVTFPQTVPEALALLYALARLFRDPGAAQRIKTLETAVEWTQAASVGASGFTYFCPIWQEVTQDGQRWWMTFNQDTYAHSLLALFGGQNIFAKRLRRYPFSADFVFGEEASGPDEPLAGNKESGERDRRYPVVSASEVEAANPGVILLPDEPFAYSAEHKADLETTLAQTSAVLEGRVFLLDGSLITWHGTRLALSLQNLPPFFAGL